METIPFVNLAAQFSEERDILSDSIWPVLENGLYVDGPEIETFENKIASYHGSRHAVAVSSGTSALSLTLQALGVGTGHEVITSSNSFISSAGAIISAGATPVFVDVCDDQNMDPSGIEQLITEKTRAIMPVHLSGRMTATDDICKLATKYGLFVVEDAAQSVGSSLNGRKAGTFGDAGCFSAHPLKNLNAVGDAGFIVLNDDAIAKRIRMIANNGFIDRNTSMMWGTVARMDSLQAAVLSVRLGKLNSVISRRRANAALYKSKLDPKFVFVPNEKAQQFHTYHTFVIQVEKRDELKNYLTRQGIGSAVHYPVPIHLQPAAISLGYKRGDLPKTEEQADRILSIPIHQFLKVTEITTIADSINSFFSRNSPD